MLSDSFGNKTDLEIDIHPAIYQRRPEINAIVHTHPPYVTGYSALGKAIEAYDQMGAFIFEEQAIYDEFPGTILSETEATHLATALGGSQLAVLKNHGLIAVGENMAIALGLTLLAERAARIQSIALQCGATTADTLTPSVARQTKAANLELGHFEDTWQALVRRLKKTDPDLFNQ